MSYIAPLLNFFFAAMSDTNFIVVDEPLIKLDCILGEGATLSLSFGCRLNRIYNIVPGPLYDDLTRTLHFVDIVKKQVLHYDTTTGDLAVDQFDEGVSCLSFRKDKQGVRRRFTLFPHSP